MLWAILTVKAGRCAVASHRFACSPPYSAVPFRLTIAAGWHFVNGHSLNSWNPQMFSVSLPFSLLIQINSILCFQWRVDGYSMEKGHHCYLSLLRILRVHGCNNSLKNQGDFGLWELGTWDKKDFYSESPKGTAWNKFSLSLEDSNLRINTGVWKDIG